MEEEEAEEVEEVEDEASPVRESRLARKKASFGMAASPTIHLGEYRAKSGISSRRQPFGAIVQASGTIDREDFLLLYVAFSDIPTGRRR